MRKVLDKRDEETDQLRVNFVESIMAFEERFMEEVDQNFLIRILKSLARGNLVQVVKVQSKTANPVAQSATASQ